MKVFLKDIGIGTMLNVSPQTLRIWRMKGQGPPWYKFGKAVRYDQAEVEAWAKKQQGGNK